jgi:hypothetical protein
MTAVLLAIEGITKLLERFNKGTEPALKLYRFIEGMFKGTPDAFPDLPDEAVILLFKQRADKGVAWIDEELARVNVLLAEQAASPPPPPPPAETDAERRARLRAER